MEFYGLKTNTYDPCLANEIVNGKKMTVSWHVYDLRVSHKYPVQIIKFELYLSSVYEKILKLKIGNIMNI